jgi:predicted Zn-dependent protease
MEPEVGSIGSEGLLFPQLLEVALLASRYGKPDEAGAILRALEGFRPGHASLKLGQALARIYSNRPAEAIPILKEEVLVADPGNSMARAFLGLAFFLTGQEERSRDVLLNLVSERKQDRAEAFSRALLALSGQTAGIA